MPWAAEPLIANGDDLTIRQLVVLLQGGAEGHSGHLLLKAQGDIAQLLLDITHNFLFGCGGEAVATLSEGLQVQMQDGIGEGILLLMGTVLVTPLPESKAISLVWPEAYRDSMAWMAMYMAGVLKVLNMI